MVTTMDDGISLFHVLKLAVELQFPHPPFQWHPYYGEHQ